MYDLTKRLENLLGTLQKEMYTDSYRLEDLQIKEIGYEDFRTFLEPNTGYQAFDSQSYFGKPDQHYCVRVSLHLPKNLIGKKVVLSLKTGATDIWNTDNPQFILYVDGKIVCALDINHAECILSNDAEDREYVIHLHAYTNTCNRDVALILKVQALMEEVKELYYDLKVPFETACLLKDSDDRKRELLGVLNDTMNCIDFRVTGSQAFYESVQKAKAYLQTRFYEKMCGPQPASVHSIGHTHIDIAWKWRVRQTREKAVRSFSTVLYLMEHYPEYKFMSSQPILYQFVKEEAPELFAQIKERVRQGRWEVEGSMWLEADTNLSSGESLVRHILYGKQFFAEEFGKGDNVVLWLPDVFGYSAALPQILKKSEIKYFMTTKLGWNESNRIPNDVFFWQGIDGSEILTYFITTRNYETNPELKRGLDCSTTYNGLQNASQTMGTWQMFQNKDLTKNVMTCYGYGDGGGGTTPAMLEQGRRLKKGIPGCPNVKLSFVREFFETLEADLSKQQVPKWCGDLYLEFHRGTYTSMARNKRNNRKMEAALLECEFFMTLASIQNKDFVYDKKGLDKAWKLVLLNQFHDILPGSAIKEVYEDSDLDYQKAKDLTDSLMITAKKTLMEPDFDSSAASKSALYVWNTLGFARSEYLVLPKGIKRVKHHDQELLVQKEGEAFVCLVKEIPANGYTVLEIIDEAGEDKKIRGLSSKDTLRAFDTLYYQVEFNETGEITRLYDKTQQREIQKKGELLNQLLVFEDRPYEFDAWNIDAYYVEKQYPVDMVLFFEVEQGALFTKVTCKKQFLDSTITQEIYFYEASPRIDFKTSIDWKQEQLLLKAQFPLDLLAKTATCDIQFGNIARSTHKNTSWEQAQFEVCAHKWVDLSEAGYGVSLLNDCKYGYSFEESTVAITLIKSGIFPNPEADKEMHQFTYSLYPHKGDFRVGKVVQAGYQLNTACSITRGAVSAVRQRDFSLFGKLPAHVILESVKRAEQSEDVILRLYEAHGKRDKVSLDLTKLAPKQVWSLNLLEKKEEAWCLENGSVSFEIKPYEIVTIGIERNDL